MLPPGPPKLSGRDFDPSTVNLDEDVDMDNDEEEGSTVELSSIEINILIYLVSSLPAPSSPPSPASTLSSPSLHSKPS